MSETKGGSAKYLLTVKRVGKAAEGLHHLLLDTDGTPLAGLFTSPGQYLKLSQESLGSAYFAIASAPGGGTVELLLKSGTPLSDALIASRPGDEVFASAPQGRGFPLAQARGGDLLLFATGSGISAIRSCIEAVRRDRSAFGKVQLYFGVRTPDAFAYEDEQGSWEGAGIQVMRVVSRPGATGWAGLKGYVQEHLEEAPLDDAWAFLCGHQAMVEGVTAALLLRGLPKDRIFLNY